MQRIGFVTAGSLLLALTIGASASAFEGVVKWRDIVVPRGSLAQLAGEGGKADPAQILALSAEKIRSHCQSVKCQVEETTIYVKGKKMRVEGSLGEKKDEYMIADVDTGTFWMVSPGEKKYMEWTRSDAREVRQKAEQMKKMLSAQLKAMNLPAEQVRQIEEATAKVKPRPKPTLRPLNQRETINGFATEGWEVSGTNDLIHGWVTRDLGELAGTVRTWTEGMRQAAQEEEPDDQVEALLLEQGLPVRVQTLAAAQYNLEELLSVTQQPLEDTLFDEPPGFQKTTMEQMMRGMMGNPMAK